MKLLTYDIPNINDINDGIISTTISSTNIGRDYAAHSIGLSSTITDDITYTLIESITILSNYDNLNKDFIYNRVHIHFKRNITCNLVKSIPNYKQKLHEFVIQLAKKYDINIHHETYCHEIFTTSIHVTLDQ